MPRVAAPVAPMPGVEADAKLAFVEFLLTSIDIQESARRAGYWRVAHPPVTEAAVRVAAAMSNDMQQVAEHGI